MSPTLRFQSPERTVSYRLLIVEDDDALREMLCLHFQDQGLRVDGAEDAAGRAAIPE
jgi:DNA-binding response OmpR family regulator